MKRSSKRKAAGTISGAKKKTAAAPGTKRPARKPSPRASLGTDLTEFVDASPNRIRDFAANVSKAIFGIASVKVAPGLASLVAGSAVLTAAAEALAKEVSFTVAPQTLSRDRIQGQRGLLGARNLDDFRPRPDAAQAAAERLRQLGFNVLKIGRFGITATGPAKLVSDVMKIELGIQALPRRGLVRATQNFAENFLPPLPDDLYIAPTESLTVKAEVSEHIDDFVFVPPPLIFADPSADPPAHTWNSVDEARIRKLLNVPQGTTGTGVKVALIDTGFFRHPYYKSRKLDYQPTPTPSAPKPENDTHGHGTAIAYNVFAVAPGATVLGFQQTDSPQDALEDACEAGADIISCSWGWPDEQSFPILEATIRDIANDGRIILFASGNGQQAWPGSMPDILSVGGVYADAQDQLEASNYASGFTSNLYEGRRVPDVSGLCGQQPQAIYIMLPCPSNCVMDKSLGGTAFPDQDGTKINDGWVGASGTSSATPQVAAVTALLVERARAKGRKLTTADVRKILQDSAVPVEKGRNAQGFPAVGHPNIAVGHGLVDADKALGLV